MKNRQVCIVRKDSLNTVPEILRNNGVNRILLVCGNSFINSSFYNDFISSLECGVVTFHGFSPNPKYEEALKGIEIYKAEGCDAIVSVGGGSAIDTAKCIKCFLKNPPETLANAFFDIPDILHVAIPTTAGTGAESTRFAVIYENGNKASITHDDILPEFAIVDGNLLKSLPAAIRGCTLLDAMCQAAESIWSKNSDETSVGIAADALRLLSENVDEYVLGESAGDECLFNIAKGSNLAGQAINITKTTAPHAMSYKITTTYGTPHGLACALTIPFSADFLSKKNDDGINMSLDIIAKALKLGSRQNIPRYFVSLISKFPVTLPAIKDEDIEYLTGSVNIERLSNMPIVPTHEDIASFYRKAKSLSDRITEEKTKNLKQGD